MRWVVDCSFTAALFLPDEYSTKVRFFFEKLKDDDNLWVPGLWWYELTNVLVISTRRNRLTHMDTEKILSLINQIDFKTDNLADNLYSREIYEIAQLYDLSGYDAAYLELAIRKNCNLASFDKKLVESAQKAGVKTFR
ncbi:MAG: type II toxin-antitoxin system VapC family toxin [Candidatus Aminicenantes bacterium]|nr:type II toxin-antitoxin system VapC family toxin [Candidatus Aminicenantes bacterium]